MDTIQFSNNALEVAMIHGCALPSEITPETLTTILKRTAASSPHGFHYISRNNGEQVQSYKKFLEEAKTIAAGLANSGLKPKDKVILQLRRPEDFILAFWGCVLGGFVAVPMSVPPVYDPLNLQSRWLCHARNLLESPLILTASELTVALSGLFQNQSEKDLRIRSLDEMESQHNHHLNQSSIQDVAAILLTSGSTGFPKFVSLSHLNFFSSITGSAFIQGLGIEDVSLNWLPFNHVSALMRSIRDLYVGCEQYQAQTSDVLANPLQWIDWVDQHKITITWAPNFAFASIAEALMNRDSHTWNLNSVKSIVCAGEPALKKTIERFTEVLRPFGLLRKAVHVSWGMTEACFGSCSLDFDTGTGELEEPFAAVGKPIPGLSIRITDSNDRPVPIGSPGNVQIHGPIVTNGYYGDPALNKENFTEDGWLKTGDLGVIRNGSLIITGRQKDLIIINGVKYSIREIEAIIGAMERVSHLSVAVCIVRSRDESTEDFVVFFQPVPCTEKELFDFIQGIRAEIYKRMGIVPLHVIPVERIPRSAGGKILRSELREQLESGALDSKLSKIQQFASKREFVKTAQTPMENMISQCFSEVLKLPNVELNANFFELGGSSVYAIRLASRIAKLLPEKDISPLEIFAHPTIRQLSAHLSDSVSKVNTVQAGTNRASIRRNRLLQRQSLQEG